MAIIFGNKASFYPGRRIFANDLAMADEDYVVKVDEVNNPTLILARIYGPSFATYMDIFFAVNRIVDPYTQLTEGKALHIVRKLDASSIATTTTNVTKSKQTTKVKHLKTNKNKITF